MVLAQRLETPQPQSVLPDLIIAPSEHLLYWHTYGNRIRPLNDFLLDPRWGLSEARRADFPLAFWQQDQAAGQQIGIPALRAPHVFFYNLTWASELGFSRPPESVDDFRQHACTAARANNSDNTGSNDGTGGWMVDHRRLDDLRVAEVFWPDQSLAGRAAAPVFFSAPNPAGG